MTGDLGSLIMKSGVDYIGVVCIFVCHDGNGKVLLQKRSAKCRDEQGTWDCGGGKLEFGESFEAAVAREVREEYLADAHDITFCGVHNVLRDNNGTPTHWVALTFAVRVDPAEVGIGEPEKVDELGWFTMDALPAPLHSAIGKDFAAVRKVGIL